MSGRIAGARGQATVEFALVLPVLVLALLAIVQVALVVRDLVSHGGESAAGSLSTRSR